MKKIEFFIEVNGSPKFAQLHFASQSELRNYHKSLSVKLSRSSPLVRDAIEFSRLAAKRWRYYSNAGEGAESFVDLQSAIKRNPAIEVAFILIATTGDESARRPIGLTYCRRTWSHHLALDFLALHPNTFQPGDRFAGIGSGMIFGVVQLAKRLRIQRIWGEATAQSAPFYERLLAKVPIMDFFVIEAPEMAAIAKRQDILAKRA